MDKNDYSTVNNLISNYLGGNPSKEEIQALESWISESHENLTYFRQLKNIWEATEELPISVDNALEKVMNRIDSGHKVFSLWHFLQKAAAILFIPLLIATMWLSMGKVSQIKNADIAYNKVVAAFGSYTTMVLPDGSKVWLNAGSSLQYPNKFIKGNRNVYLIGEAYFEVHADKTAPFLVSTPYFTVKATGTRFSVMAEKDFRNPSVTLVEGKVAVQKVSANGKNDIISILSPNQHMIYDTLSEHARIQTEDTYKYIAWKDGKLVFRNDLLTEVTRRISLQYNVDIEIAGDKIKQYRYRATFENEPLSELLRLLKISSPIDYREIKPVLLPDSSLSKRKIIIFSAVKN